MACTHRPAVVDDIHTVARALPAVSVAGTDERPIYQVRGKSFVFFRGPRPDARDPDTGERYADVVCFWVPDEETKRELVEDPRSPWFTTPHFDGYAAVLLRTSQVHELSRDELVEVVQDAWLTRAPRRLGREWLDSVAADDPLFVAPVETPGSR